MQNQGNQENTSFNDQADGKFDRKINSDREEVNGARDYSKNLMNENPDASQQVRETEDASLQDDTYSFDETNTNDEEYHDVDDMGESDLTDTFETDDNIQ